MTRLRYLALGDSYTIGESVDAADRWPVQLQRLLNDLGFAVAPPQIVARTGWTTDELAEGILEAHPEGRFDLVTLLIGVNNQYRGRGVGEYREQFGELLESATVLAGGEPGIVIVVSIPDWGVTPFAADRNRAAIANEIDEFNVANQEISATRGARYVDITECSRLAATEMNLTASDGLHPSKAMYGLWADLILPEAGAVLSG